MPSLRCHYGCCACCFCCCRVTESANITELGDFGHLEVLKNPSTLAQLGLALSTVTGQQTRAQIGAQSMEPQAAQAQVPVSALALPAESEQGLELELASDHSEQGDGEDRLRLLDLLRAAQQLVAQHPDMMSPEPLPVPVAAPTPEVPELQQQFITEPVSTPLQADSGAADLEQPST
jgi:hypothetical protein